MALIEIEHVGKVFDTSTGERFAALEDVNLSVEKGEFVCLLGLRAAASPPCFRPWPDSTWSPRAACASRDAR